MDIKLTEETFFALARQSYQNPQCVTEDEFFKDLTSFKYIQKCLGRYKTTGQINERLILNYLITISNLFGILATKKMLEFKINPGYWSALKPFLVFLGYVSSSEYTDIIQDDYIIKRLRDFRQNGK